MGQQHYDAINGFLGKRLGGDDLAAPDIEDNVKVEK